MGISAPGPCHRLGRILVIAASAAFFRHSYDLSPAMFSSPQGIPATILGGSTPCSDRAWAAS